MTRVVIDRRKVSLEYATDCIIIRADGCAPRSLPLNRIHQIICMHSVQLTTQLIGQLYKRGIDLVVINQRHEKHSFAVFADQQKLVERRCRQYEWQLEEARRLDIAKTLCRHKFTTVDRVVNQNARHIDIGPSMQQLDACLNEQTLRGIEGVLQRKVFEHWRGLLPEKYGFRQRERRPPKDPVNALLSLTYTIVYQDAVRQARRHGLDPQLGFYHRTAFGRHSLACDLMEPVRPCVEAWVTDLFANGTLDRRHFSSLEGRCLLGKSGRAIYYEALDVETSAWQRHLGAAALWVARKLDNEIKLAA